MAAEDGGVTDGRTNLIPNVVKDGSWHQHAGKHTEPSLFSLIAGLKGLAEVNQNEQPTMAEGSSRPFPHHPLSQWMPPPAILHQNQQAVLMIFLLSWLDLRPVHGPCSSL